MPTRSTTTSRTTRSSGTRKPVTGNQRGRLVQELDGATVRRAWGETVHNAARLDEDAAAQMVAALNTDHAGTFNLFYLVRKHYWSAEGAESGQVAEFLQGAYKRLADANDDLAARIWDLGGVPATTPPHLQEQAEVRLEAEHLYSLRASLEGDLDAYATLAASLREHIDLAAELDDEATRELLEQYLETVEADAHTIERFLEDDTLVEVHR